MVEVEAKIHLMNVSLRVADCLRHVAPHSLIDAIT